MRSRAASVRCAKIRRASILFNEADEHRSALFYDEVVSIIRRFGNVLGSSVRSGMFVVKARRHDPSSVGAAFCFAPPELENVSAGSTNISLLWS